MTFVLFYFSQMPFINKGIFISPLCLGSQLVCLCIVVFISIAFASQMVESSLCVVVRNVQLNQTHHLDNVDTSAHFHELLISYCRIYRLDFKNFVFLVPCEGFYSRTLSWKVAPPSMRLSECICGSENALFSDYLFNPEERRVYVKCVPKQDVSQFVSWNNCISTKYSKSSKVHSEVSKSTLPHSISRVRLALFFYFVFHLCIF